MVDSALETLWKNALAHWEEEPAHRAFLEHCRHHDLLVEAAVRYRGMKGDHARGAIAERKLSAITVMALTRLESARTPDRRRQSRVLGYLAVAFFIAATVGLLAYLGPVR